MIETLELPNLPPSRAKWYHFSYLWNLYNRALPFSKPKSWLRVSAIIKMIKNVYSSGNVRNLMRVPNAKSRSAVDSFVIYLSAGAAVDARLTLDTDESYHLQVLTKGKHIEVCNSIQVRAINCPITQFNSPIWPNGCLIYLIWEKSPILSEFKIIY